VIEFSERHLVNIESQVDMGWKFLKAVEGLVDMC
jgi:hypothetical protein